MANKHHHEQLTLLMQEVAATFVSTISNRQSLITVTRTELTEKQDRVTFFVSVFPESAEEIAIGFLMRKRGECREQLKSALVLGRVPHVEFAIDDGEKRRRKIDALLSS
jgi:ribosome-binding factor A